MKNHVINRDKIYEAFINEPYEADIECHFSSNSHGWQIVLITGYLKDGYANRVVIDKSNEQECIDFIHNLNFIEA